jgi:ribosomal protein S18 acetylase RimI-like enzyme
MISLRRLTADDALLLSQLGSTALIESHGHSAPPHIVEEYINNAFSEKTCVEELLINKNIFHAIYINDQPAGYSKISFNSPQPSVQLEPVTNMKQLYLLKEFYNLKLGHQLMQHAIDLSKAKGEKGMWLNVWKENERAFRFYKKQGFEIVGEMDFIMSAEHANPNWVMLLTY